MRAVARWPLGAAVVVVFLAPFAWMAASSLKPRAAIFADVDPVSLRTFLPLGFTLENFGALFAERDFGRALANSIGVAVATSGLSLLVSSMLAFALARLRFRGRNAIFALFMVMLLVPFEVVMVPMFVVVQRIGLDDSYASLVLPWLADPLVVFFLRQQFAQFPREIEQAAVVDGCGIFRIYWSILIPNVLPALVTAGFIKFFMAWDAYVWPLIAIKDPDKAVLPVAIGKLFTDQGVLWGDVMAAAVLSTLPLVALFLAVQRQYVQSVASAGVKG